MLNLSLVTKLYPQAIHLNHHHLRLLAIITSTFDSKNVGINDESPIGSSVNSESISAILFIPIFSIGIDV